MEKLLKPSELDRLLGYPSGRSIRQARASLIPCYQLPDGEIRFDAEEITRWLASQKKDPEVQTCKP